MKKRVLSFLVACVMVVSTFIISKPLVHVHAVEGGTPSEDTSLDLSPLFNGSSRFDVRGNVELAGYKRDAEGTIADKIYTEGTQIKVSGEKYMLTDGVSGNQLWMFNKAGVITNAGGHHNSIGGHTGDGIGSVLIFTAPDAGKYEFKFTFNSNWAGSRSNGIDIFIMSEDGTVLDSDQVVAVDQKLMSVDATVELSKGEKIYIVRSPMDCTASDTDKITQESVSADGAATVSIKLLDYFSNSVEEYELPYIWHQDLDMDANGKYELASKYNGLWRLTSFSDPSKISTMTWNDTHTKSYVESAVNRGIGSGASAANGWTSWYVNANGRWNGGSLFGKGDNASWLKVSMSTVPSSVYRKDAEGNIIKNANGSNVTAGVSNPGANSKNPTVVFTAPQSGEYYYTEFVKANNLLDDATFVDARDTNRLDVAVTVTVRKNGAVLDTVTIDKNNTSAIVDGKVLLGEGDLLMFTFTLATPDVQLGTNSTAETANYLIGLSNVKVKLLEDSYYALPMDWNTGLETSGGWEVTTKGQWELTNFADPTDPTSDTSKDAAKPLTDYAKGCNSSNIGPTPYIESTAHRLHIVPGATSWTSWYVNSRSRYTGGPIFANGDNTTWMKVSAFIDANNNLYNKYPTAVFTADEDGVYTFNETVKGNYLAATTECTVRKNGKVIASFTPTEADPEGTLNGTVTLEAGDKLMFTFALTADATADGQPGNGANYSVAISDVYAVKTGELCEGEHTYVDGVCSECGYDCAFHDWKNETGTCTICGVAHTHKGGEAICNKGAICDTCKYVYTDVAADNHDWSKNNGVCANCGTGCDHFEWSWEGSKATCGTCGFVCPHAERNDEYICTLCGHDCEGDHVYENGECTVCGAPCFNHNEKTESGVCATCGKGHTHDVTADDATCQNAAVCSICGYEVAPVNAEKHTVALKYQFNSDMTHTAYYDCCDTIVGTEECVRGADDKCVCGIDFSLLDKAANLDNIIDDFFANNGKLTGDYTVSGPAAGALDGFKVVKPADNLGVEYAHFNLRYEEERGLILRHHFISNVDEFTLTVNGEVITPENVEGTNIYFFDVIYPIATYDQAAKIVIEVEGETVEYNVSIYSYLAIALEKGDESTQTLAKAIYDLNEGCLKYLAEKE